MDVLTTIFLDTNVLYYILHKTPRTNDAIILPEKNPDDYVIDTIIHSELIYTSTLHYLEHKYGIKDTYSVKEIDKKKWVSKGDNICG